MNREFDKNNESTPTIFVYSKLYSGGVEGLKLVGEDNKTKKNAIIKFCNLIKLDPEEFFKVVENT